MKRFLVIILLLVSPTACAEASSPDQHNCSPGGEICVDVRAEEPIAWGEPVTVNITVTSEDDFPDIGVSLYHDVDVVEEDIQNWEKDSHDATIFKGGAGWKTVIQANKPLIFTRKMSLPLREGWFTITADVANLEGLRVDDSLSIHLTRDGGKVYLSGTSIPITQEPLPTPNEAERATMIAIPTVTPYPTMPPTPTKTIPTPEIAGTPAYPPPESLVTPPAYPLPETPGGQPYP